MEKRASHAAEVPTSMRLPAEVWEQIKIKAVRERKSLRAVMLEAMEQVLRKDTAAACDKAGSGTTAGKTAR